MLQWRGKLLVMLLATMAMHCATPSASRIYYIVKVQEGDTLQSIANKFDTDVEDVLRANRLSDDQIQIGQKLKVYAGPNAAILKRDQMIGRIPETAPKDASRENGLPVQLEWPIKGHVSSGYGRRGWRQHTGIDIRSPKGTPINAAGNGVVTFAGWRRGYGNTIEIRHDPIDISTVYAHCLRINVRVGQEVSAHQVIGQVGKSGNASGYHLHFEVLEDHKNHTDPMAYLPRPSERISAGNRQWGARGT